MKEMCPLWGRVLICVLALLEVYSLLMISAFSASVQVGIIFGSVCNSTNLHPCNFTESLAKNLIRMQL